MTGRVYQTALGTPLDLGALILKNEKVRAVGNMKVNARGDSLDGDNKTIETKNKQLKRSNERQVIHNVSRTPVTTKSTPKPVPKREPHGKSKEE